MKAKEWVTFLTPLTKSMMAGEEGADAQFKSQVANLRRECMEVFKLRTGKLDACNYRSWFGRDSDTVIVNAMREANVKWKAVVVGVNTKLGQEAPYPLIVPTLILGPLIADMHRDTMEKKKPWHELSDDLDFMRLIAWKLLLSEDEFLKTTFSSFSKEIDAMKMLFKTEYIVHADIVLNPEKHPLEDVLVSRVWLQNNQSVLSRIHK